MDLEEFRRWGHRAVDWVAEYLRRVEDLPVAPATRPGDVRKLLPAEPPVEPEPFDAILADLDRVVVPHLLHWQSPKFFGYYPANHSPESILGELIAAGLGVQGMLWATGPACTELETHVLDWLVDALALPGSFKSSSSGGGVIQDSASSATLCALVAARERAQREDGGTGRPLVAYASREAHLSVEKAARIAGLEREGLRRIDTDERFRLRSDPLQQAIEADLAAGRRPCFVAATVGTTSSGSVDPLPQIGPIARRHGLWLHVDAAMAGTAALCPEFRHIHAGLEYADSYCFNPHKWMFVNFDCDCFYVADRTALTRALGAAAAYLQPPSGAGEKAGGAIDYRDWQVPLGRRFRALKLWFVLRGFGLRGLQRRLREHVALAERFARWVQEDPRFELVLPPALSLVCFRLRGDDRRNEQLHARLVAEGKIFLTTTRLAGRCVLRMCIAQSNTTAAHVETAWQVLRQTADSLD